MDEAKRFMSDCLTAVGACCENAEILADNLITADKRGFYSHGMNRLGKRRFIDFIRLIQSILELYVRDIKDLRTDANATPEILKETPAVALMDGKNGLGAVVGKQCMNLAIKKAKDIGIGFVTARGI